MSRILILCAASLLAGCASLKGWAEGRDVQAERRGQAYASEHCAGCHAISGQRESPNVLAKPFADFKYIYSGEGLMRELEVLGEVGHYNMPPTAIPLQERRDLLAYMGSLKGGKAPQ